MSVDNEKVPNEFPPDGIEYLRASNLKRIASSKELIYLLKTYMQERDEERKKWIMMDIMAKSEAKRN